MADHKVISSDGHVVEPPDLWTDRMDPKLGDLIPHLVEGDSADQWHCGDQRMGIIRAAGGNTGMRFERPQEMEREGKFSDVRLGGYDPHVHIKDIEIDGVHATMIFPTIARQLFSTISDYGLAQAVCVAYNDWLAEFCKPYPDRLKGVPMILLDDVEGGIAELKRTAKLGLTGAMISNFPAPVHSYANPRYEPFWETAESMGAPLCLHTHSTRPDPAKPPAMTSTLLNLQDSEIVNDDHWVRMSLSHIILSGVFERYPDLKVVAVEHGAGWVPYFMQSLDANYTQTPFIPYRFKGGVLPSEFLRRNVYYSFQEDHLAISMRHVIGVDNLMWGSDYPHAESTFPRSREILDQMLEDVPEDEKAKIEGGNCARVFNISIS